MMIRKLIPDRSMELMMHLLVALLILFVPLILMSGTIETTGAFLGRFYLRVGLYALFFYTCYLYLVPKFYMKGRRWLFLLLIVAGTVLIYLVDDYLSPRLFPDDHYRQMIDTVIEILAEKGVHLRPPSKEFHAVGFIIINLLLAGTALGLRLAEALSLREKEKKELEKQHLATELSLLKNQISPHFFFNTLNNIYALTEIDTGASQQSILKLSRLMRYLLYETDHEATPLKREIEFLNDYIDLMRLRLSDKVAVSVTMPSTCENVEIPPLLFIPFVENAFKHGISYREPSFIHIAMECQSDGIHFRCANSRFNDNKNDNLAGGIGLENARKRLDLIYGSNHRLQVDASASEYVVTLNITL